MSLLVEAETCIQTQHPESRHRVQEIRPRRGHRLRQRERHRLQIRQVHKERHRRGRQRQIRHRQFQIRHHQGRPRQEVLQTVHHQGVHRQGVQVHHLQAVRGRAAEEDRLVLNLTRLVKFFLKNIFSYEIMCIFVRFFKREDAENLVKE